MHEVTTPQPDLFRYLDYRDYLRDMFQYLAAKNKKYSQRWIAMKAGWKSPQLLSMILKGERKLSIEHAQMLSLALGLNEKEEEYLLILVELESASHQAKQLEILDRIRFQFQNGFFKDLPDTGMAYIKKWFYPVAREMAGLKNFEMSAENLARALAISEPEAAEALELLLRQGLLARTEAGYRRQEPSLKAVDYVSPLLMMQYHLQILERAFLAVQLKREFRHFDSLTISMNSKDFESIREKIRQFIREIDMIGETAGKRDDVFQLSIQFFSLTGGRATKELSQ